MTDTKMADIVVLETFCGDVKLYAEASHDNNREEVARARMVKLPDATHVRELRFKLVSRLGSYSDYKLLGTRTIPRHG
jgi:hypothetical protein